MKIGYINPNSSRNLAEYDCAILEQMGKNPCLNICFYTSQNFNKDIPGVTVKKIFTYYRRWFFLKPAFYTFEIFCVIFDIFWSKIEVTHTQWHKLAFVDLIAIKILKKYGKRTVFTAHNIYPHGANSIQRFLYKLLLNEFSAVIVHTREAKVKIGLSDPMKISVVSHPLIYKKPKPKQTTVSRCYIGLLGKWDGYKRYDKALRVYKPIELQFNFKISFLTTENKLRGREINLISVRCDSDSDFQDLLRKCNIIVLPHDEISASGLLINALSNEIPVIATKGTGSEEIISQFGGGLLIEGFSPEDWYIATKRLAKGQYPNFKSDIYPSNEKITKETLDVYA
jgi:glycosyltransferase involved in cell wall biosynthesis